MVVIFFFIFSSQHYIHRRNGFICYSKKLSGAGDRKQSNCLLVQCAVCFLFLLTDSIQRQKCCVTCSSVFLTSVLGTSSTVGLHACSPIAIKLKRHGAKELPASPPLQIEIAINLPAHL